MSVAKPDIDAWSRLDRWRKFGDSAPGEFSLAQRAVNAAASAAIRLVLRVLGATLRIQSTGDETLRDDLLHGRANALFVGWHNRLPGALTYHDLFGRRRTDYKLQTIVSASRDGEYLARMIRESSGFVIRGSSSRDAASALKQAISELRAGANLFSVGDGPRGPRYVLKPGPILLAKQSGLPIYPFTWACSRVAQLHRSWDQMMVPLPGSHIKYRFGEPLLVPETAGEAEIADLRRELEGRLAALTQWADANTRVALQFPRPKPGEVLKRRKAEAIESRRV